MDLARSKVSATEPGAIVGEVLEVVFELELLRTLNSTSEASFRRSAAFFSERTVQKDSRKTNLPKFKARESLSAPRLLDPDPQIE